MAVKQRLGAADHLLEVGQIELDDARETGPSEARRGHLAPVQVAHRQYDVRAATDEPASRLNESRRALVLRASRPRDCRVGSTS